MAPPKMSMSYSLEPVTMLGYVAKRYESVNLEMGRLSWMIWMSDHESP